MADDPLNEFKDKLRPQLFDLLDLKSLGAEVTSAERERLRHKLEQLAARTFKGQWHTALHPEQRARMVNELLDETLGLGPLEGLLKDPAVSEIMVNGPSVIFVERHGRIERANVAFRHRDQLLYVIERILAPMGRRVTQAEPYVDARLPDGSRMNVALAPVAIGGPYLTIRKFSRELFSLEGLVRMGTLTQQAAQFLRLCTLGRLNIVISGAASSGKTTLMDVLANLVPAHERIVVIEDTAELQLNQHQVVRLETRPASIEGRGEITIRNLLKNAFHMRPDRIFVGEVRGEEALDMLQAMNTGHDGSMTTLHANTPLDVLDRIETMALLSRIDLSSVAVERQVRSAIDLIVHLERFPDGSRRVTHISEVRKGREASDAPLLELFTLVPIGTDLRGVLTPTGTRPAFLERLHHRGVEVPEHLLAKSS